MSIDLKKMKLVSTYELQKEFKDDAIRKIASKAMQEATKHAKSQKVYILIYFEK